MGLLNVLLIVIGSGAIAATIFGIVANLREEPKLSTSLAFSFILFVIMQIGLFFFRDFNAITTLSVAFNSVIFTIKYALLSTLIGIILAIIFGLIRRILKLLKLPFFM